MRPTVAMKEEHEFFSFFLINSCLILQICEFSGDYE